MPADFEAGVRIDALWEGVVEQLEKFTRRREAILSLTGIDEDAGWPGDRLGELIRRAAAVAVQDCVSVGLVAIYVLDPRSGRFFRLPKDGLVSPFIGVTRIGGQDTNDRAARTSETSWGAGTLYEIDCDKSLFRLAHERVPLMTSEAEARAVRDAFPRLLENEANGSTPEPPPTADPEARSRWIADLEGRSRWSLPEALLWIGFRDLNVMADLALLTVWDDAIIGPRGVTWALSIIEAWRGTVSVVEHRPDDVLMRKLRHNRVRATGVFEGRAQRQWIDAHLWEDLEFRTSPTGQRSGSAACRIAQVHGVPWSGHWVDILFERDALIAAFPAIESSDDAAHPNRDEWIADLMSKAKWSLAETLAWVAFRHPGGVAAAIGPGTLGHGALDLSSGLKLDLLLSIIHHTLGAVDRSPRAALEFALQRQGFTAAGVALGGHSTHRLEDLLRAEFWRADVLAAFPEVEAASPEVTPATEAQVPIALTEDAARQLIEVNSPSGGCMSQSNAVALIKRTDPAFDRDIVRRIVRELSGREGAGRPRKSIGG
jgi:hypothetical protein